MKYWLTLTASLISIHIALLGHGMNLAFAESGTAIISGIGTHADIKGTVSLSEADSGLDITIQLENVPPGDHGIHIHQYGACTDEGKDAGGHFNPDESNHGEVVNRSVYEVHPGDLGNIRINADGSGSKTVFVEGLGLTENIYNVAGRAIILHEKEDDFGQPTGNAGGRIGCGIIAITK